MELLVSRDSEIQRLKKEAEEKEEKAALMISKLQSLKCFAKDSTQFGEAESKIAALQTLVENLIQKYEKKVAQYKEAANDLYGSKSEKRTINVSVHGEKKRRGSKYHSFISDLKSLMDVLEHRVNDVDFASANLDSSKYERMEKPDCTLKLEGLPVQIKPVIIENRKYLLKDEFRKEKGLPSIISAQSDDPYHNSVATASLVSSLTMLKYIYGVPIYRIAEHSSIEGFHINATTLDQILQKGMADLKPLADLILKKVMESSSSVIHADETVLRVVEDGSGKRYVYQMSTSRFDAPATYFDYTGSRSSDEIKDIFHDGKKYTISCDGFGGYEKLRKNNPEKFTIQSCNFHSRKMFVAANDALDKEARENSVSGTVIRKYGEIFHEEERIRDFPPQKRLKARKRPAYRKLVKELIETIESIQAEKDSLLDDAKNYFLDRRDTLFTYLENGYLDMTNNLAERKFRLLIMARQNFLLCRTAESAKRMTDCYSLVSTAMDYGIDLFSYLTFVFEQLKRGCRDYESLCPWNEEILKKYGLKNKNLKENDSDYVVHPSHWTKEQ